MVQNKEIYLNTQCAAVKEGCRIIATTFLSLLLPLSFLLLSRLSAARYFLSINDEQFHKSSFLISLFLQMQTTLILTLLVSAIAIGALTHSLTGYNYKSPFLISQRRRIYAAWVLLFLIQVCLSLGIYGTVDAEINGYTIGKLVPARRAVFAFGLHEVMIFWRRNVVSPAVDEAIFGFTGEGFSLAEKGVLAVAFGNLWWRRLKDEAEALVVLPWVRAELSMDVEAMDVVGWGLYYLTAAIGGVWVVKGFFWGLTRIFR